METPAKGTVYHESEGSVQEPESPISPLSPTLDDSLEVTDLSFSVRGQECPILNNLSAYFRQGRTTCVIGPSGSGKSAFLQILSGRLGSRQNDAQNLKITCSVSAGGLPLTFSNITKRVAFVASDQQPFATVTPTEALDFALRMRLPDLTPQEREKRVQKLIKVLHLEECQHSIVGNELLRGISSGEKKRTAVGMELVTSPGILVLDEPTSGLDSFSAYSMVADLKRLAKSGKTVVAVVHQPSSEIFYLFDDVIFLSDGRILYNGPVHDVVPYFANLGLKCPDDFNPADFVVHLSKTLTSDELLKLSNQWAESKQQKRIVESIKALRMSQATSDAESSPNSAVETSVAGIMKPAKFIDQFTELNLREWRNLFRDRGTLRARIFNTLFQGFMVGLVFFQAAKADHVQSHFGALMLACNGAMMLSSQSVMLAFPLERPIVVKEQLSGFYGVLSYYLAKSFCEIPTVLVQCAMNLCAMYWLIGFNAPIYQIYLSSALLGISASSVALFVGCMVGDVTKALEVTPLIFMPQMMFAGFYVKIDQIVVWLRWLQYVCFLKYGLNVSMIFEFKDDPAFAWLLSANSVDVNKLWFDVLMLFLIIAGFRILGYIGLRSQSA